jgi:hypothetical protein
MGTVYKSFKGESQWLPAVNADGSYGAEERLVTTRQMWGKATLQCAFCHSDKQDATGYWFGRGNVLGCCRTCALNVLPRLMADCLVPEGAPREATNAILNQYMTEIQRNFWEATTCAVVRNAAAEHKAANARQDMAKN